jgi:hypothetical protein
VGQPQGSVISRETIDSVGYSEDETDSYAKLDIWNVSTGQIEQTVGGNKWGIPYPRATFLLLTPDGNKVIWGYWDQVRVYDIASKSEKVLPITERVSVIAITSDSKKAIGTTASNSIIIWDLDSGSHTSVKADKITGDTMGFAVTPDDQRMAACSLNEFVIYNLTTGLLESQFANGFLSLDTNADGSQLIVASLDDTVEVWRAISNLRVVSLASHYYMLDGIGQLFEFVPQSNKLTFLSQQAGQLVRMDEVAYLLADADGSLTRYEPGKTPVACQVLVDGEGKALQGGVLTAVGKKLIYFTDGKQKYKTATGVEAPQDWVYDSIGDTWSLCGHGLDIPDATSTVIAARSDGGAPRLYAIGGQAVNTAVNDHAGSTLMINNLSPFSH